MVQILLFQVYEYENDGHDMYLKERKRFNASVVRKLSNSKGNRVRVVSCLFREAESVFN